MTNEEAIKGLKNVSTMFTGYKPNEEMFEMAIKALETVSCIKEKCAYRPHCENCDVDDETLEIKALEQTQKTWGLDDARENFMNDVYNILDFLPTNNEANRIIDSFDRVTSGLEQQPCEDAVSRQAIKRKLQEHHDFFIHAYGGFSNLPQNDKSRVDEIINCIAMVVNEPPVTPKEKTGHWEVYEVVDFGEWKGTEKYKCSECGEKVGVFKSNFCPNCGARMVNE